MGGGHHIPRGYLKIHVSTDTGPITPWHGSGCCQRRGAGQGGGRKRRPRAPVLTACCISLSGSSACIPSRQSGWGGGTGIFNSCFFCLTQGLRSTPFSDQIEYPTPSPTGASQKGQCLQIGDHSFQDLPRGPQGWLPIRPGISHSPLVNAPGARRQHSPPGIGARGCPGNPKPPSIIILAFVIRQTGPWTIGCFLGEQPFQLPPPHTHTQLL